MLKFQKCFVAKEEVARTEDRINQGKRQAVLMGFNKLHIVIFNKLFLGYYKILMSTFITNLTQLK
jgi:hypothetical protein